MRMRNLLPFAKRCGGWTRPEIPENRFESYKTPRISAAAARQIRVDSPAMARIHQSPLTASAACTATRGAIGVDSPGQAVTATTIKTITKKTIR